MSRKRQAAAALSAPDAREALSRIVAQLRETAEPIEPGGLHFEILDAYSSPTGVPCVRVAEGMNHPAVAVLRSVASSAVKLLTTIGTALPDGTDPLLRLVEFAISTSGVCRSGTMRVAPAFDPDGGTADPIRSFGASDRNQLEIIADAIERTAAASSTAAELPTEDSTIPQYVTLDQMAAAIQKSKRTLEKWKTRKHNPIPPPDIEGGGGKPDEWDWVQIREWLIDETGKQLPERFPSRHPAVG